MRIAPTLAALLALLVWSAVPARAEPSPSGLARALAAKLVAARSLRPRTHATDFGTEAIGCITLARWELRRFGYAGHAFLCEEGATSTVLGAVQNRAGVVRCYITGVYAGDACYDLNICGIPESACVL